VGDLAEFLGNSQGLSIFAVASLFASAVQQCISAANQQCSSAEKLTLQ